MKSHPTKPTSGTARGLALGTFLLLGAVPAAGAPELRLPDLFTDGMVLQQNWNAPVWGFADPGTTVRVKGGWQPEWMEAVSTIADEDGRFELRLGVPSANQLGQGGATTLTVTAGAESVTIQDVVFGEVWLCSGQSNMEWELAKTLEAARASGDLSPADTNLEPSNIRHFTVPRTFSLEPKFQSGGRWVEAQGEDALTCSAVAYFFAQNLGRELDVPVGLIVSSWGGTRAQAWTSPDTIAAFADHRRDVERIRERQAANGEAGTSGAGLTEAELDAFWGSVDERAFFATRFKEPDFDDGHWDTQELPGNFAEAGYGDFDGVFWYRREIDVPPSWAGSALQLELPPIDDLDETFWNGVRVGSRLEVNAWSKPRSYTVPAELVRGGRAVLTVRALDTGGRGGMGTGGMKLGQGAEWIDLAGTWRVRRGVESQGRRQVPSAPTLNQHTPTALFNAMLAPLIPYGIHGVLWYQGESNRPRADEYAQLFPAMIMDWRALWGRLDLPFYFAQLAPYDYGAPPAKRELTALVREGQAKAAALPATGMVLTADIGNPKDIHPKNKWEVGRRFALFALHDLFDRTELEPNGPTLREASVQGGAVLARFDHTDGELSAANGSLDHFEVAGEDGVFAAAEATLTEDGAGVRLRAPGIEAPTAARYLWSDAAESSVTGGSGLPMAPWRVSGLQVR